MKRNYLVLFLAFIALPAFAQPFAEIENALWEGESQKALRLIEDALNKKPHATLAFSLTNKKAEALIRAGRYDEAQQLLQQIERVIPESDKTIHQASLSSSYGFLYLLRGRNDLAEEFLQQSLDHWQKAGKTTSLDAAQTQALLGNLFRATGKYAQAEEQLNVALLTRLKLLPDTHELIAASYNDLGLVFSSTDPDKALDYYEKAHAIYTKMHGAKHPKLALSNTNIGYLYSQLELFGDAINNFEAALAIWNSVYPGAYPAKGFVLFNLGRTHEKMNKHSEAKEYYEKALTIYKESYNGKHPDIARVYNALGNLDLSSGQFESALQNYQQALKANVADFSDHDVLVNPPLRKFYDGNVLLYSLLYKAQAAELQYQRKTLSFGDLKFALRTLHTCDTLIEKLRQQINSESDKITLGTIAHEVYTDGVRIATEAAANAWDKQSYFSDAFFFAEKSKAAVLLGALSDANAKSFAGIPATLLEEEKNLKSAIALCAQKLAQKPGNEEERYLRETSYSLNRTYEAFTKKLEGDYPAYFNLKYNSSTPSIKQIQEKLSKGTLLLSYFIDEKNSRLYIFQVTEKKFRVQERSLPPDFDRNITGLRNSLIYSEINTFTRASSSLADVLLPRIPTTVSDLVIIPTGRLSIVPFETLLTKKTGTKKPTFRDLPYLVSDYSVRYELSSGLILQKTPSARATPSILLCAPVNFTEQQGLPSLPGSESEVKDIANLFVSQKLNSALFLGQQADERNIKQRGLKEFSFIHFATHGVVDQDHPELSRIYLHGGHDNEDGNLYAGEIYNLELDAELVTLSACQTGLGKISKGEGVIGLSRALVYAGARNSLVSFWKVADESTAVFMQDFYRLLLKNNSPNLTATVRQAKRDLMRHEKYSSPYYWAPFILIGF